MTVGQQKLVEIALKYEDSEQIGEILNAFELVGAHDARALLIHRLEQEKPYVSFR